MRIARGLIVLSICLACASTTTERIRWMPIDPVVERPDSSWTRQEVLIQRFEDVRPPEFGKAYASGFIPVVNFLHTGAELEYPDHAGLMSGTKGRAFVRRIGGLEIEVPYLLARMLPGDNAVPADDLRGTKHPREFDYVIEGRVLQSTATEHASFVLGFVSIVGVPVVFTRQQLRMEVSVYSRDERDRPVPRKVYAFDERMAGGLYYNHAASRKLARRGLERTVHEAASDILAAVSRDQAARAAAITRR